MLNLFCIERERDGNQFHLQTNLPLRKFFQLNCLPVASSHCSCFPLLPWVAVFVILRRDLAHAYKLEAGVVCSFSKTMCVPNGHKRCGEQRYGSHTKNGAGKETEGYSLKLFLYSLIFTSVQFVRDHTLIFLFHLASRPVLHR